MPVSIEWLPAHVRQRDPAEAARTVRSVTAGTADVAAVGMAGSWAVIVPVKAAVKGGQPQAGGDKSVKYDQEDTGLGFKTDARLESYVVAQPTSCQMKRPAKL